MVEQDQCNCLILKLRGSEFPVKDSGMEGNKADPFFEIRSKYELRKVHEGVHVNGPDYKSEKVKQNLDPCATLPCLRNLEPPRTSLE